jgi:hypothetical protein
MPNMTKAQAHDHLRDSHYIVGRATVDADWDDALEMVEARAKALEAEYRNTQIVPDAGLAEILDALDCPISDKEIEAAVRRGRAIRSSAELDARGAELRATVVYTVAEACRDCRVLPGEIHAAGCPQGAEDDDHYDQTFGDGS